MTDFFYNLCSVSIKLYEHDDDKTNNHGDVLKVYVEVKVTRENW